MWVFFAILFCVIVSVASSFYYAFISVFPLENATTNVINTSASIANASIANASIANAT